MFNTAIYIIIDFIQLYAGHKVTKLTRNIDR